VLQPILVRETKPERFALIAGERRWRAAKRAGLQYIPVIVRDVNDEETLQHALVENLHRDNLNPLEEAAAYQQLIEDFNMTQEAVAHRVGKSRSAVANLLRLFQLPPQVQRLVADGQVSAGHAKALLSTPDRSFQEALAREWPARDSPCGRPKKPSGSATAAPLITRSPTEARPGSKLRPPASWSWRSSWRSNSTPA
jgi:ParB family chromosome partitioning protein